MTKAKAGLSIVAVGVALLLAGCDSWPDSLNPNKWIDYNDPNANVKGPEKTYPKLSTVPERPPPRDEASQREAEAELKADRTAGLSVSAPPANQGLIADRESARYTDENLRREEPGSAAAPAPPPAADNRRSATPAPVAQPRSVPAPTPRQSAASPPPPSQSEPAPTAQKSAAPPQPPPQPAPAAQQVAVPPPPSPQPARTPSANTAPSQLAALPSEPPPRPPVPSAAAQPPAPAVIAMAPVRSRGDPPAPSAAAPSRASELAWGAPPSDIDLVRQGPAGRSGPAIAPTPVRAGGPVASVMFASGSSKVAPNDESLLRRVAEQYLRSGGTIAVIGHASQSAADRGNVRSQIANFSVSLDRATAVAQALQRYGVPGEAIAISAQIDSVALNDADVRRADVFLR